VTAAAPRAATAADPVERDLALVALRALAVLAVPALALGWLAAGPGGLLAAGIAVAVVGAMYLLSGLLLSWAAPMGPSALMAAALGGFGLRLALYALLIVLLRPVEAISGPTLAVTAAALLVLTLAWEVRHVGRNPALFWVDAAAARPNPDPRETAS
jgi:hypothetical protein